MAIPYLLYLRLRLLKIRMRDFFCIFALLISNFSAAETMQVAITHDNDVNTLDPSYFFEKLLVLALDKTRAIDGDYDLVYNYHGGGIARDRAMLMAGMGIDVMWATATQQRKQQMRVVPVDLLKGLNNYRVLLINKDGQSQFEKVATLDDLKKFTVGSGEHWTDASIFKDNGFSVSVTANYLGLFKMLAARRFNFISRGLHEVGYDTHAYKTFGLVQEQHLLLKYKKPLNYCFFVNKTNTVLAERIARGLKIAQQDGSFDKLFNQIPSFREGEETLKNSQRVVIELNNTKAN